MNIESIFHQKLPDSFCNVSPSHFFAGLPVGIIVAARAAAHSLKG